MAVSWLFTATLFFLFLNKKNSTGAQETTFDKVYVSPFGHDSNNCGTKVHPCRSIAQAVRQVKWGGDIYLNGSGTERIPYKCSPDDKHPGICINKSLSIIGCLLPRVFCAGGFYFQKSNNEQPIQLKLSGIVFWQTSLTFEDCHHVALHNCSFRDTPVALNIQIQNVTRFRLDMQEFSFFHNNSQCILLLFLENIRNISRHVTFNISDTYFTRNGFYSALRHSRGGLKMASNERSPKKLENINISCSSVKYINNFGSFIDLNISNAVTNETYRGVELMSNLNMIYTLYTSDAKEPNARFIGLRCVNNPSTRCIRIQSNAAEVEIHESVFTKLYQALFLESSIRASLRIVNSTFQKINGDAGGSFFATSPRGHLKISFTNVLFSDCGGKKYGCTITIGKPRESKRSKHYPQSIPDELYFTLRNVTVEKWYGRGPKCKAIYVLLKSGEVTIEESRFNKKLVTSVAGALSVSTRGGKSSITISNCSLIDNDSKEGKGIAFSIVASNGNAGDVAITNGLFISSIKKQHAIFISPKYRIKLINVTVTLCRYGFKAIIPPPEKSTFPVDIYIDKCTFMNNVYDLLMSLRDPTSVNITIKNTVFTCNETVLQKSYAIRLNVAPLKKISSSSAIINLDNDTFDSKPSSNFVFFFQGKKSVTIKRSTFRNCTYTYPDVQKWIINKSSEFYDTGSGAISILTTPGKPWKNGCLQAKTADDTHPLWHYDTHVIFEDTVFEKNVGLIAGGVHISNGFTKFHRCIFQDNFGIQQTGHVYSAYGTGRVDIENCTFLRTKESMVVVNGSIYNKTTFLYSESGGPLKLKNTSMISLVPERNNYRMLDISSGGFVDVDEKSTMQCSEGSQLLFDNATNIVYMEKNSLSCRINATVLRYSCRACSPGYYSLQKGTSRGLFVNSTVDCLPCPFGASCILKNIAANPNFWGYLTISPTPSLQFFACPEHYCQSPLPDSKSFNRCLGNRKGTLCGQCAEGYTESLFSSKCFKVEKCNHYWLWIVTILLTMGLVFYLLIRPPILSFLGHQILWFRRGENQIRDNLGQNDDHNDADSGYIKITFYFYQVAEIVMDGSIESRFEKKIPFVYFVISAFNFQVTNLNNEIGCPFAGLTAVTKEMLLSGPVFLTMADVVIVYCVHSFINLLRRKEKPNLIHYVAVVMEVLLLGYERLAETSLKLMHCVSIGSGKWLFIDGNVPCFQWWQYIFLAYIAVFLLPFIVILYWGSSKLYKSSITAGEFLAACVLPLPFLTYWLFKDMCKRRATNDARRNQEVNNDVLKILHGPFRPPNNGNKGTLHWESVLIGRRFILLACHTFFTNAMLRVVCMTSACFLMTIHHTLKNPYRDPLANKAETLSLAALTLIAAINLPKATLFSFGIDISIDESNGSYLESLKWIEVVALTFIPALVSFLVLFALLSQLARLAVFLFQYIRRVRQYPVPADWTTEKERLISKEIDDAYSKRIYTQ